MTRTTLSMLSGLGLIFLSSGASAADFCLRSDHLDQISMKGNDTATARDKDGKSYSIKFTAPCGARHSGVFFVLHTKDMPTCIGKGAFLPTNSEGTCEVATIAEIPPVAPPH